MSGADCPFCGLGGGFHDEDEHAKHTVPRHLVRPPNSADVKPCRCGQPFSGPGSAQCRNPHHAATDRWADGNDRYAVRPDWASGITVARLCACGDRCGRPAVHTEHSPYMDDYCEDCTLTRCDAEGSHTPLTPR